MKTARVILAPAKTALTGSKTPVSLAAAVVLVVSILLCASPPVPVVRADTDIGGIISSDTTWTAANSPYIVTGNIVVNEGVTLTIEPGVTVKFDSAKAMQVDGQLVAQGTEAEPIVFTSNQGSPAPGDWINILFTDSSVSGNILQHCTVEYGGGSDTPAIRIVSSAVFVDRCNISDNASTGIHVSDDGSATIEGSTISGNSANDYGGGIYAFGGTVTVTGSTISGNSANHNNGGGIFTRFGSTLTVTGSTSSGNSANHNNGGGIFAGGTVTVTASTISGNSANAWGGGICVPEATVTVIASTITGNTAGYGGGIHSWSGTVTVTGSTITGNSANDYGGGIYAFGGTVTVTGSTISGNSANDYGGGIYAPEATVTGSTITGNTGGSGIYVAASWPAVVSNNLHDNTPYDVYNSNLQGTPNVDCTDNWWGTTDEDTIKEHIYDWNDDASLGVVDYVPYLTSEVDTTPPTTPVVTDDGDSTTSTTQLHATWSSSDAESGIAEYQYAIGTSSGATDVVDWTSAGTDTEVAHTGLNLTVGITYYFAVKAKSGHGLWSEVGVTDGITVAQAPPTITSINPGSGNQGDTLDVTITGTGFTGTEVTFGAGISVNDFTVHSLTQITANITIDAAASTGTRDVSVTTPGGTATLADGFTVEQAPPTDGEAPAADFSASPAGGVAPLTVHFTDESTGGVTDWEWDFDNDGILDSTEQNPSYTYGAPGKYTVSLKVSGPGGSATEVKSGYITVEVEAEEDGEAGGCGCASVTGHVSANELMVGWATVGLCWGSGYYLVRRVGRRRRE